MKKVLSLLAVAAIMAGCANTGIVPMDRGSYMISKDTAKFGGGISMTTRAEIYQEANAYCAKSGKVMETQNLEMLPGRPGQLGNVTLTFRCIVDDGKTIQLQKTPDQVIEIRQR